MRQNANIRKIVGKLSIFLWIFVLVQGKLLPEMGLKWGPQRSEFDSGGFDLSRFKFGLFFTIKISDQLTFQPEIYFSQLGTTKINYIQEYFDKDIYYYVYYSKTWTYNDTRNYIEIPLLLKYTVPLKKNLKPFVFAGGYASLRVSKTINSKNIESDFPENYALIPQQNFSGTWIYLVKDLDEEYNVYFDMPTTNESKQRNLLISDITPATKRFDGGIVVGFGLETSSEKVKLLFDWRINIGLTNIYNAPSTYTFGYYATNKKNNSMSFMVGVSF